MSEIFKQIMDCIDHFEMFKSCIVKLVLYKTFENKFGCV